jgi:phosphoribosylformimino-5-aminoimidazole carboxamide ribotide isomerase
MLEGPSFDLYRQGLELFPTIYWIASGGVSSLKDLEQLEAMGIPAVIVGKALYEGRIPLEELSRYARQAHKNEISLPTK